MLLTLSGIILSSFAANLSSTIVATALPSVFADLDGNNRQYTWATVVYVLGLTVSTPVWGKCADLFDKKRLFFVAMGVFLGGSACAGLAVNPWMFLIARGVQGMGTGGIVTLSGTIVAAIVAPRLRGKFSSYLGVSTAIATLAGPLVGGLVVGTPGLGWRACFYLAIPIGLASMYLVHRRVQVPRLTRDVHIDYGGVTLLVASVAPILFWLSLADDAFGWLSLQGVLLIAAGLVFAAGLFFTERRVVEPLLPLRMFTNRVVTLVVIGSFIAGVISLVAPVYVAQYFQIGRGWSPLLSGAATIPTIFGAFFGVFVGGRLITRLGVLKPFLIGGAVAQIGGCVLLGLATSSTPYPVIALGLFTLGAGIGSMQQHMMIAIQNSLSLSDLGVGMGLMGFSRALGGAFGLAAFGTLLKVTVVDRVTSGARSLGISVSPADATEIPTLRDLEPALRHVYETAYSHGFASIFMVIAPLAVITLVCVILIPEKPMSSVSLVQQLELDQELDPK